MTTKTEEQLAEALVLCIEEGGEKIDYHSEEDEIGTRACCNVMSYKNHAPDCWVTKSLEALAAYAAAKAEGEHGVPVSVPDEIECKVGRGAYGEGFDEGWNACRKAMLASTPTK